MMARTTANEPVAKVCHTVPVALLRQLIELVERWHVPAEELLAGSAVVLESLDDPFERLSAETMNELLQRARELTGEPALGYYLGLQKRASVYGYLGFAVTSAASLGEALALALRFAPMFSTALTLELRREGPLASLEIHEQMDLGPARDIILISLMVGLHAIAGTLTGRSEHDVLVEVALPETSYPIKASPMLPRLRFGQPANRLVFDAAHLEAPIVTADRTALNLAQTMCERALDELGFDAELVDRVRRLFLGGATRGGPGFRSLEEVAKLLHMSPRTLKRRLAARGISFSALVDHERREQALALLRQPRLSIDDVAERLDYSTASTFVRAFQRWMGTTPAAYRRVVYRGATYTR